MAFSSVGGALQSMDKSATMGRLGVTRNRAWKVGFTPLTGTRVGLTGCATAFVSDTTMALVEDGEVFGSRRFDTSNSG